MTIIYLSVKGKSTIISSIKIKQVDSTGAGDLFVGTALNKVSEMKEKNNITFEEQIPTAPIQYFT